MLLAGPMRYARASTHGYLDFPLATLALRTQPLSFEMTLRAGQASLGLGFQLSGSFWKLTNEGLEVRSPNNEALGFFERPHAGRSRQLPDARNLTEKISGSEICQDYRTWPIHIFDHLDAPGNNHEKGSSGTAFSYYRSPSVVGYEPGRSDDELQFIALQIVEEGYLLQ